jgi:hypothetical protein
MIILAQEATIEHSGGKLTLDNDPVSFAAILCVTAMVITFFVYKIKRLNKEK